ncbi:MAG: trypsin-like peptidase domain-containing protein [Candidatus Latescibacterota bacterium]|nr:trypsin-like peptidase domain-containing protein [Candidatus Latescibacterota bacterium]MEE2725778.1 trypsin-like peptidase domain-containing protein [Candidatus Latescibacterota bacterium]
MNALILLFLLGLSASFAAADTISQSRRTAVVSAVEQVQPAVVSVHVTTRVRSLRPYRLRDPFWDFFSPFYYVVPEDRERPSTGSGLIINSEGYILTNDHVVGGDTQQERRIRVSLPEPDGRTLEARYIASDIGSDLAVLKVDALDLPVAPLGNSDDILVGEWAIAIGNPFDLGPTVSIGVISALDRDFPQPQGEHYYRDMIQTDAAINPGNSGGPLVNADGEVIGINSFIYTGGDYSIGSIGIGFAIPISTARNFLNEVQQHGQVRRAWSGIVALKNITQRLADYLSLSSTEGALVVKIAVDSPADQAGLESGDVIVAINGEKMRSGEDALGVLRGLRVDEECTLHVVRYGEHLELSMRLKEWPRSRQRW